MQVSKTCCQGTEFEFTVVLELHQGTHRQRGVIVGGALSFLLFGQAKSKNEKCLRLSKRKTVIFKITIAQHISQ
jgi:hypothetical protein